MKIMFSWIAFGLSAIGVAIGLIVAALGIFLRDGDSFFIITGAVLAVVSIVTLATMIVVILRRPSSSPADK